MDDIVISGLDQAKFQAIWHQLQSLFKLKVLRDLKYFLSLEIARSAKGICLS